MLIVLGIWISLFTVIVIGLMVYFYNNDESQTNPIFVWTVSALLATVLTYIIN